MKNTIISIVVFVVVVAGAKLMYKGVQYQYAEHQVNNNQTYQAPKDFKADVIKGCVDSPQGTEVNRPYCVCTVDYLQETMGDVRFQAMALDYVQTNTTPPEMDRAVEFCIDKFVLVEGS